MVHLLSCANFGSAALRRNLSLFLPMPVWEVQESSMWVCGGQGRGNGETPGGFGLWPPGPFLAGGGEPGLWGGKRSVLCRSWWVLSDLAASLTQWGGHSPFFPTPPPLARLRYKNIWFNLHIGQQKWPKGTEISWGKGIFTKICLLPPPEFGGFCFFVVVACSSASDQSHLLSLLGNQSLNHERWRHRGMGTARITLVASSWRR